MIVKTDLRTTDTKERILKEAQRLYLTGGYSHMSMDKIADILSIKRPALYYHFPGGKEELLIEMMEAFTSEKIAEWEAAFQTGKDIRSKLHAVLSKVIEEPLLDSKRMLCAEMERLDESTRLQVQETMERLFNFMLKIFEEAIARGELRPVEPDLAVLSFGGLCQQIENITLMQPLIPHIRCMAGTTDDLIDKFLDVWLNGFAPDPVKNPI